MPGEPRARIVATAESSSDVAYALLDEASGKRVFVIDAFTYEPTGAQDP